MVVGVDESRCLTVPDSGARRLAAVMFTDMVGYTALFQSDERDAVAQRSTFVTAVESAHTSFGGSIVARLGDGTMSTFESAATAVEAAVSLQRELQAAGVQVRIGLHAGEVIDDGATIIGDAVNVTSRIESFAVPGGVMVSESVRDLLRNRPDVVLGSLGAFELKNVGRPMELFAVVADGIVVPAPSALEGKGERYASLPTNLPEASGPLVGRAEELDALVELVLAHRIVTVTGPGGVGKTRLLAEVGRRLLSEFLDGVAFVSLADVSDPTDLLATLAEALDVKEAEGRSTLDGVSALIGTKRALLLLDNFEQLVDAAPDVGSLVASCPHLRVVVSPGRPFGSPPRSSTRLHRSRCPRRWRGSPWGRCSATRPSRCSSSARAPRRARCSSRRRTPQRSAPSASGSTACRSLSSWRPRASSCSRPKRCSSGSVMPSTC